MSRIGNAHIVLPQGVELTVSENNTVTVKGPLGQLSQEVDKAIVIEIVGNNIHLKKTIDTQAMNAKHGLYRALIANMVIGVTKGYKKSVVINGVGYKATITNNNLILDIGFSHQIKVDSQPGIKFEISKPNQIDVIGIDKELVGRVASNIRDVKPVEPYHAYGIRYLDEVVVRKEGKTAKK